MTTEGIRFIFTSFVPNFQGFGVVAVTFIAMMGAGVAEAAGLMTALIRKLVKVAPRRLIAFLHRLCRRAVERRLGCRLSDPDSAGRGRLPQREAPPARRAGGGLCRRRRGLHGQPDPHTDRRMLTEITNESIALTGGTPITIAANFFFRIASSVIMAIVAAVRHRADH